MWPNGLIGTLVKHRILAGIVAFVPAAVFGTQTIYTCKGPNGIPVFSDAPCGAKPRKLVLHESGPPRVLPAAMPPSSADVVENGDTPMPTVAAPPDPAIPSAYRCETADGMVFYRHQHCPTAITVTRHRYVGGLDTPIPGYAPVAEKGVSNETACAAIHAVDAGDRFGSDYDEHYTTYQRNAGDDPCE